MLIHTVYSNQSTFDKQDNPFINFLLRHPIRITLVNNAPYIVLKDLIEALGYSPASSQHLCLRCLNKMRVQVVTPKGVTSVNIIPPEDALPLILQCRFRKQPIRDMQYWIMDHVFLKAKSICHSLCYAFPTPETKNAYAELPGKQACR